MIKRILVLACLFLTFMAQAQDATSSPYSFYGLGDQKFKGTIENRSMGGLSVFQDSIHINLQNPAQYAHLKRTTLATAATFQTATLKTNEQNENARRTNLDYLAFGFPMGKFGAGFGLMPYTAVGYQITATDDSNLTRAYEGSGGVNKAYLGGGYKINKNFSVGAEFNYYFGSIETSSLYAVTDVQYGSQEFNESQASGSSINLGLTYKGKINSKVVAMGSLTYSPEGKVKLDNIRKISTVQIGADGGVVIVDPVSVEVPKTEVALPSKISVGGGFGVPSKWMVGTEFTMSDDSSFGNRFNDIDNVSFDNGMKYSLGGYYTPNANSYSNYFNVITYRAGFKYEKTGLIVNTRSIEDVSISAGMGFPIGGNFSNINLGIEYGKRGTTASGLVQENYLNVSVGLSFSDRWFVKRKID
ncbi:hypothetical protein [Flavobacterium ardleyense]|uniref:hypothetical protein n=1 Tax=Flavobacterium ardleyense TaxID=2038737 RepID=UPI00298D4427|nr:hypothetical protein [Flavobacterium ardleyense]